MKSTLRLAVSCLALGMLLSCKDSGTAPSETTPSVSGLVTDVISGGSVAGVAVAIQGKTATTNSDGRYSITGLTAGQASLTAQHQGHRNFTQNVTIAGATATNIPLTPSNAAKMAGTWRGTTPGRTAITMAVSVDTIAQTVQVVLEIRGRRDTFSGEYSTTTEMNLTRTSAAFGNIAVKVTPSGPITGSLTNHPAEPDISRIDFTVTGTSTAITVTYTIRWTHGDVETETLTLTK